MSKPAEKKSAPQGEQHHAKGGDHPAKGGEQHHSHAPKPEAPKKGEKVVPGGCLHAGCKTSVTRFGFCDEHYDQFKFGLIKKTGELVSDWEKKFEHYQAYKAKQKSARKVA